MEQSEVFLALLILGALWLIFKNFYEQREPPNKEPDPSYPRIGG